MKTAPPRAAEVSTITANRASSLRHYVREVWAHRRLVLVLTGRELKGSYEMNWVGFIWWILDPLSFTLTYVVVIDFIFRQGAPNYPLFLIVALLPFKWLSGSLIGSMNTIRANAPLVTDVYFPRALLPMAELVTGLAHFAVAMLIVPIFMAIYGIGPSWHLIFLPLIVLTQAIFILGLSYPMSVWGAYYRNLPGLTGNLLRLWLYLSPALWDFNDLHTEFQKNLVRLNPLTGIFQSYRDTILNHRAPSWDLAYAAGIGLIALVIGGGYFVRRETQFGKLV